MFDAAIAVFKLAADRKIHLRETRLQQREVGSRKAAKKLVRRCRVFQLRELQKASAHAAIVAARCEATASARDFAVDDLRWGNPINARCIEITDEQGKILETLAVRDVVTAGCS
jgi:hypothetical protein